MSEFYTLYEMSELKDVVLTSPQFRALTAMMTEISTNNGYELTRKRHRVTYDNPKYNPNIPGLKAAKDLEARKRFTQSYFVTAYPDKMLYYFSQLLTLLNKT